MKTLATLITALIITMFAGAPAMATDQETITISWYLPAEWNDPDIAPTAGDAIWPQPIAGDPLECGRWIQQDVYWLDAWLAAKDTILANGTLDGPHEDSGLLAWEAVDGNPWQFTWTGDCEEIIPDPPAPFDDSSQECVGADLVTETWGYTWAWDVDLKEWVKLEHAASSIQHGACLAETGTDDTETQTNALLALGAVILGGMVLTIRNIIRGRRS